MTEYVKYMRNYRGYNKMGARDKQFQNTINNNVNNTMRENKESRSKLVIDESTIYEIDMDCYECLMKNKNN